MRSRWFGYWATAVAAAASWLVYPRLPLRVAVHFTAAGQPNGYGSRLEAVILLPLVMLGLRAMFEVLPRIDPTRENYRKSGDAYWLMVNGLLVFLGALHLALLAHALGMPVRIDRVVAVAFGVLLVVIGSYMTRVEPNGLVGIRTRWTLSSEGVWRRTHRLGGWVFVMGGVVCLLTVLLPTPAAPPVLAGVVLVCVLVSVVGSYVLWRQEAGRRTDPRDGGQS